MAELGTLGIFLGIETENWSLQQFQEAADNVKALGATSLLFKVADGTNAFYESIGGYTQVAATIQSRGINAIPYTYDYGDKFGALSKEIAMKLDVLKHLGILVSDMETEYNGHDDWAKQVTSALKSAPGVFGVCSWGDPQLQQWSAVLAALEPCTNFWLPQVYSNFLANHYVDGYKNYKLPIYPVVNLTQDFGPNDPVSIATNQQCVIIWHYENAVSSVYRNTVLKIRSIVPLGGVPAGWFDDGQSLWGPARDIPIQSGFRDYILTHAWASENWPIRAEEGKNPLEISNPGLGAGTRQVFRETVLEWTPQNGVFVSWVGQELLALEAKVGRLEALLSSLHHMHAQFSQKLEALWRIF